MLETVHLKSHCFFHVLFDNRCWIKRWQHILSSSPLGSLRVRILRTQLGENGSRTNLTPFQNQIPHGRCKRYTNTYRCTWTADVGVCVTHGVGKEQQLRKVNMKGTVTIQVKSVWGRRAVVSVGTQILSVDTGSRSWGLRCTDTRREGSTQRPVTNAVRLYHHSYKHKTDWRTDMHPKHALLCR